MTASLGLDVNRRIEVILGTPSKPEDHRSCLPLNATNGRLRETMSRYARMPCWPEVTSAKPQMSPRQPPRERRESPKGP